MLFEEQSVFVNYGTIVQTENTHRCRNYPDPIKSETLKRRMSILVIKADDLFIGLKD